MAIDPKKALGRPTLYKQEYCEALIEHMKQGLSFEAFGAVANVSVRTLFDWKKAFPEFEEAYLVGQAHSLRAWEQMGLMQIWAGKGAPAVWIFNMRNRFGWRDDPSSANAEKEKNAEALDARDLTDEEIEAQIRAKLATLPRKET